MNITTILRQKCRELGHPVFINLDGLIETENTYQNSFRGIAAINKIFKEAAHLLHKIGKADFLIRIRKGNETGTFVYCKTFILSYAVEHPANDNWGGEGVTGSQRQEIIDESENLF